MGVKAVVITSWPVPILWARSATCSAADPEDTAMACLTLQRSAVNFSRILIGECCSSTADSKASIKDLCSSGVTEGGLNWINLVAPDHSLQFQPGRFCVAFSS